MNGAPSAPAQTEVTDNRSSGTDWQTAGQRGLHFLGRLCLWLLIAIVIAGILDVFDVDVVGWFRKILDNIRNVSPWAIALALVFATIGKLLSSVPWTAALRAAYPDTDIPYKVILASNQAGSLIKTFAPAKAGSVAKLGIMRVAINGSSLGTIVAVSALTSVVSGIISAVTFGILIIYERPVVTEESKRGGTISDYIRDHPFLTIAIVAAMIIGATVLIRHYRPALHHLKDQFLLGGAILRTPGRFVLLVIVPSILAYLTKYLQMAIFMDAFNIPVTIQSLILVIAGRQFSGLIAVTPGGIGTKQAVDVIALKKYAPSDVVTSFSIAQDAVAQAWNIIFGIIAMSWGFGTTGAREIWTERDKYIAAGRETGSDAESKFP